MLLQCQVKFLVSFVQIVINLKTQTHYIKYVFITLYININNMMQSPDYGYNGENPRQ